MTFHSNKSKIKVALIVSHPVQHFCPQYVSFARHPEIKFKVFFASALGFKKYTDPNFKREISWGNLNLDKFDHCFLNGEVVLPSDASLDAPQLDDQLSVFNPDVVISYGYFQKLQRRAQSWAKRKKIPVAYISDSEMRQHRSLVKRWIKYPLIRKYFSNVTFFLSVGDANEIYYRYYGASQDSIIRMHFPIDIDCYRQAFEQKQALNKRIRDEYSIPENEMVLSVVGKLVPWKNQDHIIEALSLLEKEDIKIHLFILGSGDMLEAWQRKANVLTLSKVYFPGFVPIETLPSYYAATDIYVHPAAVEPHSIAVSEAIYMGCPVILSDRCGSYGENDDVSPSRNGLVYSFGDIAALARSIKALVEDKAARMSYATDSHARAIRFQERSHKLVIDDLISKLQQGLHHGHSDL